jgi:Mn-dependent DtxR family transcriptional regulator
MTTSQQWHDVELPVLTEVVRRVEADDPKPNVSSIAGAIGLSPEDVQQAAIALAGRGLVQTITSAHGVVRIHSPSPEAYRLVD